MAKWGPKDPDAIRDYSMDWSDDTPEGATISTSTWLLDGETWPVSDPPLGKDASSIVSPGTVIRLSGGTAGESYRVTNRVVFSDGQQDDKTETLKIKER